MAQNQATVTRNGDSSTRWDAGSAGSWTMRMGLEDAIRCDELLKEKREARVRPMFRPRPAAVAAQQGVA